MRRALLCAVLVAGAIFGSSASAYAACTPNPAADGDVVTCTGTDLDGVGTGTEDGVTVTVQAGAAIAPNLNIFGINLRSFSPGITNNGTITASFVGITAADNNAITNNGVINSEVWGIFAGDYNVITNNGVINAFGGLFNAGIFVQSFGAVTNNGTINVGDDYAGILAQSGVITNNGTINAGVGGRGIFAQSDANITNNGTINVGIGGNGIDVVFESSVTNNGTIKVGDSGTGIFAADGGADGTSIVNKGTVTVGNQSTGIWAIQGYRIVNSGTITAGLQGAGILAFDANGIANASIVNDGTITVGDQGAGINAGFGYTVVNNGTITAGALGSGVRLESGVTFINFGTVRAGAEGFSIATCGCALDNIITNNGTLDGQVLLEGIDHTVTNSGLITITNAGTPLGDSFNNFYWHNIVGTFTQTATGTLALRVGPDAGAGGQSDGLVAEVINLAGTLRAVVQPGLYGDSTDYLGVVMACGCLPITGTFDKVVSSSPFFTATATYVDPGAGVERVDLTLTRIPFGAVPGLSKNQQQVGNALENGYATGLTGPVANFYGNLLASTSANILSVLSGEVATGGPQAGMQIMDSFLTLLSNPFGGASGGAAGASDGVGGAFGGAAGFASERALPPDVALAYAAVTPKDRLVGKAPGPVEQRWGVWGSAYGGYNSTGGDAAVGSHDRIARTWGLATGFDYRVSSDLKLGFALGGGSTAWGLSDGLGSGKSDVFQLGGYGIHRFGAAYVSAALSYAWHDMSTDRTVAGDRLTAAFKAHSVGGRLETGYRFATPVVGVTPYAALQVQAFRTPAYAEFDASGASLAALSFNANTTTQVRTELGAWVDRAFALDHGTLLALRGRLAWAHNHADDANASALFQTLPTTGFTVQGAAPAADAALVSAVAELRLPNNLSLSAKFDGEFAGHSQTYAGTGRVRYAW